MPTHGIFDVEISLAKGIIFRKIVLANGAILKPWAAHPCPKFSREPPSPMGLIQEAKHPKTILNHVDTILVRFRSVTKLFQFNSVRAAREQASKQTSKQAGKQANKKSNKTSKQANKRANKQAS